jgi:hypothetical protein
MAKKNSEQVEEQLFGDLAKVDIVALDYDQKVKMLERVASLMLETKVEFVRVSGRFAELKAELEVLKQVKSALQSSIRAEGPM